MYRGFIVTLITNALDVGIKKVLAGWAKRKGAEKSRRAQYNGSATTPWGFQLANYIVLSKIKKKLGLSECRYCYTGAAPISLSTLTYFASLDIPVYELFGQSECTGPHSLGSRQQWKLGTCGRPMPGMSICIVCLFVCIL